MFVPYSTRGGHSLGEHCQAVNIQDEDAIVARLKHTDQSLVNTPVDSRESSAFPGAWATRERAWVWALESLDWPRPRQQCDSHRAQDLSQGFLCFRRRRTWPRNL